MRRFTKLAITFVAAAAASLTSLGVASAGGSYTNFGSATGTTAVTFTQNSVSYDAYFNRSASGIVQQWREDGAFGLFQQFKPITSGGVTTPFKEVCDSLGLTAAGFEWTYGVSVPTDPVLDPFFRSGVTYWVCTYDLYSHAQGALTFDAFGVTGRQVAFNVHTGSPFGPAGGSYTYTDSDGTYTVDVTGVTITATTVAFTGQVTSFLNPGNNWGDVTDWYVTALYDHTANTWAAWWGPTPPADPGSNYPVATGGATIYVR